MSSSSSSGMWSLHFLAGLVPISPCIQMMKLPILPCAEKLELVLSTADAANVFHRLLSSATPHVTLSSATNWSLSFSSKSTYQKLSVFDGICKHRPTSQGSPLHCLLQSKCTAATVSTVLCCVYCPSLTLPCFVLSLILLYNFFSSK